MISRAEEGKLGTSGLTFPNPLLELGGLEEQAMNNAVLSVTAMNSKLCQWLNKKMIYEELTGRKNKQ